MSRYRPPSEKGSLYVTAEGYARLRDEYDQLWRVRRPEVVRALAAAAAEGDRSENAEYQYRKKELREIDRRVHYLQVRLPELQVVDRVPDRGDRVFFVGPDEAGFDAGYISVDSPLARALLGKGEGEVFRLRLPSGETEIEVVSVGYDAPTRA